VPSSRRRYSAQLKPRPAAAEQDQPAAAAEHEWRRDLIAENTTTPYHSPGPHMRVQLHGQDIEGTLEYSSCTIPFMQTKFVPFLTIRTTNQRRRRLAKYII
jgi:hypothetical protein